MVRGGEVARSRRSGGGRAAGRLVLLAAVASLAAPAVASAYTVTVNVHGAGQVAEVLNQFGETRDQGSCAVSAEGTSESTETSCVLGTESGLWESGDVVRLSPTTPQQAFERGWRFDRWVDGSGAGQVDCDPQGTTGDHTSPTYCEFEIFEDLHVDLYFRDLEGPDDTDITSGPPTATQQATASFNFDAPSEPHATFECRLDRPSGVGAGYSACGDPSDKAEAYSGLTENGTYALWVRAVDPAGNEDSTPDTWTWTVDTVAPTPSISDGPAEGSFSNSKTAEFTIGADEMADLTCNVSPNIVTEACSPGTETFTVQQGPHTFTLTATDPAGNVATATRTWTVDLVAPKPTLGGGPAEGSSVASTSAAFDVGSNDGTLACDLDGTAAPCPAGTQNYASLGQGLHTFTLTATDVAGNVGAVSRTWIVDTVAPVLTIAGGPAEGSVTAETGAGFAIATSEGALTCSLDGVAVVCVPPAASFSALAPGTHTFTIAATDKAGNASSISRRWTVVAPPGQNGGGVDATDRIAPALALFGKAAQRGGMSIRVGVSCPDEECLATATGAVLAGRRLTLEAVSARVAKGGRVTLALKLDAESRKAVRRRLRRGKKAVAQVTVTAEDAAGNSAEAKRRIRLKR